MATSKEAQVLAKLLKNADPELRKFAKSKLKELKKLEKMLKVPRLRKFAIRNLEESAEGC